MESTGIVIKKQSEISTTHEKKFRKLVFEEITVYQEVPRTFL